MADQNENSNRLHSVTVAALCAGVLALFGQIVQEYNRSKIERDQFESNLILKSLETGDSERTRQFLKFFIETGFISDKNDKISRILADTSFHIKLPSPSDETVQERVYSPRVTKSKRYRGIDGVVTDRATGLPLNGVVFRVYEGNQLFDSLVTDSSGSYSLALPNSTYARLSIDKLGYERYNKVILTSFKFRDFTLMKGE